MVDRGGVPNSVLFGCGILDLGDLEFFEVAGFVSGVEAAFFEVAFPCHRNRVMEIGVIGGWDLVTHEKNEGFNIMEDGIPVRFRVLEVFCGDRFFCCEVSEGIDAVLDGDERRVDFVAFVDAEKVHLA